MSERLAMDQLARIPEEVACPGYDPSDHGAGIVHFGIGAFHRAHQAVYTDSALSAGGGDWRIDGISLRSTEIAEALNPQDGLYTLLISGPKGVSARVIGSIRRVIAASLHRKAALEALAAPQTRIASMTVTEKAYGIDRRNGEIDPTHPAIAADLANPHVPTGVVGMLVEGLRLRRDRELLPFTVLCCDNLPENGKLVRLGAVDFARHVDPALADWIEKNVSFPSTMVDRITPASTQSTLVQAEKLTGFTDLGAIETEPFTQWVIEDTFTGGRPAWEAEGAILVPDVAPYEAMKLRMLNGTHSMLAYAGFLSGRKYVRDVMADSALARLVRGYMNAAAETLSPLPHVNFAEYADSLAERFANPAIAHETYQIAMDGTEKLPQRILNAAMDSLEAGLSIRPFAFAVASWMRYALGRTDDGVTYALRDPREEEIRFALSHAKNAPDIARALLALPGVFPERLMADERWTGPVTEILADMLEMGVRKAVEEEAARMP